MSNCSVFPWWVFSGAQGISSIWPRGSLRASNTSPRLSDLFAVTCEYGLVDIDITVVGHALEF